MVAIKWIALWGVTAIASAVLAAIIAGTKRRDHSAWAAWCFVMPPLLIALILLPVNTGPLPRRRRMDDDDPEREVA